MFVVFVFSPNSHSTDVSVLSKADAVYSYIVLWLLSAAALVLLDNVVVLLLYP